MRKPLALSIYWLRVIKADETPTEAREDLTEARAEIDRLFLEMTA